MDSIKATPRDEWKVASDTNRGSKNIETYQSSSTPRTLVLHSSRVFKLDYDNLMRQRSLETLRIEFKETVERRLSVLRMHNTSSIYMVTFFGRPYVRRLLLELREVERILGFLRIVGRALVADSRFNHHPRGLDYVYGVFGRALICLDDFESELEEIERNLERQEIERNLLVLHEQQHVPIQIIGWPWTEFSIQRKQAPPVSTDASRSFILQCSGREHKDHTIKQTTILDGLQAQREPLDDWAIAGPVDMNVNSLSVSNWRLWEGRSKEWRRCKVLKTLSSTPFHTIVVKGRK